MADKQASEIKNFFSLIKTHKTTQLAYGCMLGLLIFTFFLAFSPNTTTNLYSVSSFNTSSVFSKQSFTSFFSHFFPNSKHFFAQNLSPDVSFSNINKTQIGNCSQNTIEVQNSLVKQNQSIIEIPKSPIASNSTEYVTPKSLEKHNKSITEVPNSLTKQNQTTIEKKQSIIEIPKSPKKLNSTEFLTPKPLSSAEHSKENNNITENGVGLLSNITSGLAKKQSKNESNLVGKLNGNHKSEDIVNSLKSCDLFDGEWVKDDSYPLYKPGSCSLIDEQFNCFRNGRPDNGYYKLKWKPKGCSIPRLNGTHMLEMLRGKRLVFVGDSLNRNMWESLVCILKNSVKDQRKVYEASGRRHFRTEPFYSFVFKDYDCTIEFFVSPFLVQEWEMAEKSGSKKETLRLDIVRRSAAQYKSADILVFNTGHWWTHEKTAKGTDYYQEGKHIYHNLNVLEAFHKALTTWGKWVDANVDPKKALVFFRGYSASHFKGGQWNSGGQCDHETEPIKNTTYLSKYPPKMAVLEQVLNSMKTRVSYLNITRLTDYRKDGHPSLYRKQTYSREELKSPLSFQDCSHWCLPGVPDSWNELLYADLLIKESENKKQWQSP